VLKQRFRLTKFTASGLVIDGNGKGIEGILFFVLCFFFISGSNILGVSVEVKSSSKKVQHIETNKEGKYTTNVRSGQHVLSFKKKGLNLSFKMIYR